MYSTTGFHRFEFDMILADITDAFPPPEKPFGRPSVLTDEEKLTMALTYLRRNRTQQELADEFGVSQPLVSEVVDNFTKRIAQVFGDCVPALEDLSERSAHEPLITDGTLVTSAEHAYDPELHSGKHRKNGCNLQIVSTLEGELAYVSDPLPGKIHDAKAIRESGILDALDKSNTLGDKGYVGLGLVTPIKNRPDEKIREWEKTFSTAINSMRSAVERCIAHLKRWKILATRYRRPIKNHQANHSSHHRTRILEKDFLIKLTVGAAHILWRLSYNLRDEH